MEKDFPIFRNYLEEEDDKPYFSMNSLAYYYEDMERKQKLITDMSKLLLGYDTKLNVNLEEMEKRIAAELGKWDGKVEELPETVNDLLTQWVEDGSLTALMDTTLLDKKADISLVNTKADVSQVNTLTAQLAEKAAKSEVQGLVTNKADITYVDGKVNDIGITQINKNKGLIDQTYLSDTLKQQIAGTAPINAVPANESLTTSKYADRSVSINKMADYKLGKNLFDVTRISLEVLVNITHGGLDAAAGYATSDFTPIEAGQGYFLSYSHRVVWYDANKVFISGINNTGANSQGMAVTAPANAAFARFGLPPASVWAKTMFSKGSSAQPFEPYRKSVKGFEHDRLIDVATGSETFTYGTNGRLEQVAVSKGGRTVTTVLSYDSTGKLLSVADTSEGLKSTTTLVYTGDKVTGNTVTVDLV